MDRAESGIWRWEPARLGGTLLLSLAGLLPSRAQGHAPERLSEPAAASSTLPQPGAPLLSDMIESLRSPADTALGFAEVLATASRDLPDERRRDYERIIFDACSALSALLHNATEILRMEAGAMQLHEQHVDAADLAEVALRHCAGAAERMNGTVTVELLEGVELHCDAQRLRKAIEELVIFGMTTAPGATVHFAMKRNSAGDAVFSLASPGPPPEPEAVAQLLGSNLIQHRLETVGLAVARQIGLRHGGDVTIAPGREGGTEYRLILPARRVTWPKGASRPGLFDI